MWGVTIAEEDVRFAILFALREVFRQLLKRAGLVLLRTAAAAADPAVLRSRAVLEFLRIFFCWALMLRMEKPTFELSVSFHGLPQP